MFTATAMLQSTKIIYMFTENFCHVGSTPAFWQQVPVTKSQAIDWLP